VRTRNLKLEIRNLKLKRGFATVWILIVAVAVIFSLVAVFAIKNLKGNKPSAGQAQQVQEGDSQVRALEAQSSSDELEAIEQDINATKLDDVDQELNQIDQDLAGIQ